MIKDVVKDGLMNIIQTQRRCLTLDESQCETMSLIADEAGEHRPQENQRLHVDFMYLRSLNVKTQTCWLNTDCKHIL